VCACVLVCMRWDPEKKSVITHSRFMCLLVNLMYVHSKLSGFEKAWNQYYNLPTLKVIKGLIAPACVLYVLLVVLVHSL